MPFFFFASFLLPLLQEAVSALGKLDVLKPHINSLGKILALNLPACNDAHSIPGHVGDSSSCAMITLKGHSFLNSFYSLGVYNIILHVDSLVCGQRNNSMFPKSPGKHIACVLPLSLVLAILANYWKMPAMVKRGQ